MAQHEIVISNPNTSVLRTDVQFVVKSDSRKLGTLLLSKGDVEWIPAGNSVNRHSLSWEKFAALMEENKPKRKPSAAKKTTKSAAPKATKNA